MARGVHRARLQGLSSLPQIRLNRLHLSLGLMAMVLGIMMASQWSMAESATGGTTPTTMDSRAISSRNISRLEEEQKALKARITSLQEQISTLQRTSANRQQTLSGLTADLDRQRMLAGMTALVGPGIQVVLDDSTLNPGPSDDPNNFIIHDYELRDVIALLWQSGAEAISLNGERIVANTSLYCVGTTILVNSTRLSPPYVIVAIGDPATLEEMVNAPGNLVPLKIATKNYGIQFRAERQRDVTIPAYSGPVNVKYARVPSESR